MVKPKIDKPSKLKGLASISLPQMDMAPKRRTVSLEKAHNGYVVNGHGDMGPSKTIIAKSLVEAKRHAHKLLSF